MPFEPLDQYLQRQKKLTEIRNLAFDPYPHRYSCTHGVAEILERYGPRDAAQLESTRVAVRIAGRILALRLHGKAGFAHLGGAGRRIQFYVKLDAVGERAFALFRLLDIGDIVGISGHLFRTRTGELTVWVEELTLLAKALLPLPEKWHGLADFDHRYRRRYLDLIATEHTREIFLRRGRTLAALRRFFDQRGYLEVETPMMHPILGGAAARPFVTHHNTFDLDLYLRIAPELYLKRLVVGGFDRVYEINRNFRNEGIDAVHQPEFTMLEFYQAFSDFADLMDLTEVLLRQVVEDVCGATRIPYGDREIDFAPPFARLTMTQAVCRFWPADAAGPAPAETDLKSRAGLAALLRRAVQSLDDRRQSAPPTSEKDGERLVALASTLHHIREAHEQGREPEGVILAALFDTVAAPHLFQPTFIHDFPAEISPLAKSRADDPATAERFELFVGRMELANGFSELNDPEVQERRFRAQVERGGADVPKEVDMDYIRALSHAMPPAAGEGIGVDRLVMLLTDSHAIREVIFFPLLRPETGTPSSEPGEGEP